MNCVNISCKKVKQIPIPTKPIAATVKPIIEPPKKAILRASEGPWSLAATAVLTLALVAEYIPIKPAIPEQRAPSIKDTAVCQPNEK